MSDRRPYSRVYWTVLDDPKFDAVRADMRLFGSWTLLLVVADMAYPAPAFAPSTVTRASLRTLETAGLIELLPAGMYRVKGLRKEREARAAAATRMGPARSPSGPQLGPERVSRATRVRRDETRQDEEGDEHTAREIGPDDDEKAVLSFIAQHGAFIRPESGFGQRIIGLIARRGFTAVIEAAERLAEAGDLSDRQWTFGLEERLEDIPQPPHVDTRAVAIEENRQKRSERVFEQMHARRVEYFKNTGEWNPDFGPEPKWEPSWGERPKVAA